jgi:LDH2 family malate/lactate/ureidoglycolate dehydrogenase
VRSATATEAGGRVLLPGEPETLAAAAQREHITLDAGTVASIREAAGRVMADLPFPFAG